MKAVIRMIFYLVFGSILLIMTALEKLNQILDYLSPSEKEGVLNTLKCPPHKGGVARYEMIDAIKKDFHYFNFIGESNHFHFDDNAYKPGLSPLHFGGAFYLLDPSSALVPDLLNKDCQIVLDMCAAPGGKTITYALKHPNNLIIANDISHDRALELAHNIERISLPNVIVTSFDPLKLSSTFSSYFDSIILDAPCSGSGMFNKDEKMADDWNYDKVVRCVEIQKKLIEKAFNLLRPGGQLVYSTCSYSKEEDDEVIEHVLTHCHGMKPVKLTNELNLYQTQYGLVTFPNLYHGEGQYMVLLEKEGVPTPNSEKIITRNSNELPYQYTYKSKDYSLSVPLYESVLSLPLVKAGIKIKDDRQYAKSSYDHDFRAFAPLPRMGISKDQAELFISGNEITIDKNSTTKTEVVITYQEIPLGYGRMNGNKVKNLLPKGLYAKNIRR